MCTHTDFKDLAHTAAGTDRYEICKDRMKGFYIALRILSSSENFSACYRGFQLIG